MDIQGLKLIIDDKEARIGLARWDAGLKTLTVETAKAATQLTTSGDKIKKSLDITQTANKFATAGRALDTLGIAQGMGEMTSQASLAISGIEGIKMAFAGLSTGLGVGLIVLLAVAVAVAKLKDAYEGTTPAQKALNVELERSAKGYTDATQGLVELAKVTREQGAAALEYAKVHPEYAAGLKKIADSAQPTRDGLQQVGKAVSGVGETIRQVVVTSMAGWSGLVTLLQIGRAHV